MSHLSEELRRLIASGEAELRAAQRDVRVYRTSLDEATARAKRTKDRLQQLREMAGRVQRAAPATPLAPLPDF